jgi:serine phosphatase RsbU (regulator of sigma subunit)
LLMSGALGLSAISTVLLGAKLIVQDKTSYIYDYTSSQAGTLSAKLSSSFLPLTDIAAWPIKLASHSRTLETFATALGLEIAPDQNPPALQADQTFTFTVSDDGKKLRFWTKLATGDLASFFGQNLDVESKSVSKEFSLCILSTQTKKVLYRLERSDFKQYSDCQDVSDHLKIGFEKGAHELELNQRHFIVSYESVVKGSLILLSIIPSDVAFLSARNLIWRSTVLELSLFFLIIGIVILLVRTVVSRINELTEATRDVASGNFELQLSALKSNDEVGLLANSFSLMSQKIKELLAQTAQKVRMEKELETAQIIQQKFLPQIAYSESKMRIHGMSRPASECGGDFWQYAKIGDQVIFLFGDITGHGVSAALLTAAVYGAFASATLQLQTGAEKTTPEQMLRICGRAIHTAIDSIAHGEASFPSIIAVFDQTHQKMFLLNSAHPAPYFWLAEENRWKLLQSKTAIPLGEKDWVNNEITSVDLTQGIDLFFYTDGLFDHRQPDQGRLSKKDILAHLAQSQSSDRLVENTMDLALKFFGDEPLSRPDDITIVQIKYRA